MAATALTWAGLLSALTLMTMTLAMPVTDYERQRSAMLDRDRATSIGSKLKLSADETIVSDAMMEMKKAMIEKSRQGRKEYFPSWSFYRSKPLMEKTLLFKLIRMMPKGGALHLHDQAITSIDWLVKNATYRDHLYMCVDQKTYLMTFKFSKDKPKPSGKNDCQKWTSVKEERAMAFSAEEFDDSIKRNISLLATDPLVAFPTITQVWDRFLQYFGQVVNIIFYEPVFRDYFWQALQEFNDDNVQYIELRGLMSGLYDLDGKQYPRERAFEIYREVATAYKKSHPEFTGAKFIMSGIRVFGKDDILQQIKETIQMRKKYPNFMLGYDLVGQEDPGKSLQYYQDDLLYPTQTKPVTDLPYFFHAAETNFQGTETDYNLIDAILLNTTRIGHGFGLVKHPSLMETVKNRGIAIEVNPISNQVLGLVKDPRNHAAVPLLADNFPIVISSDDPASWEAKPLSSDFYVAFMDMLGEDADLRTLKQLSMNSLKYSGMSNYQKDEAMLAWNSKWKRFIQNAIKEIGNGSSSEDLYFCPRDSPECP